MAKQVILVQSILAVILFAPQHEPIRPKILIARLLLRQQDGSQPEAASTTKLRVGSKRTSLAARSAKPSSMCFEALNFRIWIPTSA